MSSKIIDIAAAVVAELNGTSSPLAGQATAARHYLPQLDLIQLASLAVSVVPRSMEHTRISRASVQSDVQIDIAVQKKLTSGDNAEVDALMGLVEAVDAFLCGRPLALCSGALWLSSKHEPIYAPEHLDDHRVFTSVLTLTYRTM